jgi:hypothetical protein
MMISSASPSAKNACSGSLLRLTNGRTAIEVSSRLAEETDEGELSSDSVAISGSGSNGPSSPVLPHGFPPTRTATDDEVLEAQTEIRSRNPIASRSEIRAYLESQGLKVAERRLRKLTYSAEEAEKAHKDLFERIERDKLEQKKKFLLMKDDVQAKGNANPWFKMTVLRDHLKAQKEKRPTLTDKAKIKEVDAHIKEIELEITLCVTEATTSESISKHLKFRRLDLVATFSATDGVV